MNLKNKKLVRSLALALILALALMVVACGEKEVAKDDPKQVEDLKKDVPGDYAGGMMGTVGISNPWKTYDSLEALNEHFLVRLSRPSAMGVSNESFSGMETENDQVAEYQFTLGGLDYTFRCSTKNLEDISGIFTGNGTLLSDVEGDGIASADGYKGAKWFTVDGQYCLVVKDDGQMDDKTFNAIFEELRAQAGTEAK